MAELELRKELGKGVSPEMRRRVKALLEKLDGESPSGETLRGIRSIEVLENIATPEARQLLHELASGAPAARLTREAKASLERLAR